MMVAGVVVLAILALALPPCSGESHGLGVPVEAKAADISRSDGHMIHGRAGGYISRGAALHLHHASMSTLLAAPRSSSSAVDKTRRAQFFITTAAHPSDALIAAVRPALVGYLPARTLHVHCESQFVDDLLLQFDEIVWVGDVQSRHRRPRARRRRTSQPSARLDLIVDLSPVTVAHEASSELLSRIRTVLARCVAEADVDQPSPRKLSITITGADAASVECALDALASDSTVVAVEHRSEYESMNRHAASRGQAGDPSGTAFPFWDAGITGAGEIVAVADTGIDTNNCMFHDPSTPLAYDTPLAAHRKLAMYIRHKAELAFETDVPAGHGTHVTGTVAGLADWSASASANATTNANKGLAYGARIIMYDFGDESEALHVPADLTDRFFSMPHGAGARIHTNSWGSTGYSGYNTHARDVDTFTWSNPDMLVIFAAGNHGSDGYSSVRSPGTAKNALNVGALTSTADAYAASAKYRYALMASDAASGVLVKALYGARMVGTGMDGSITGQVVIIEACDAPLAGVNGKIVLLLCPCSICWDACPSLAPHDSCAKSIQDAGALAVIHEKAWYIVGVSDTRSATTIPVLIADGNATLTHALHVANATGSLVTLSNYDGSVPASPSPDDMACFSSLGPVRGELRIKPDIVAVGDPVISAHANGPGSTPFCGESAALRPESGTSMAAPAVAGLAALVRQHLRSSIPSPSGALVKAYLLNSASATPGSTASVPRSPLDPLGVCAVAPAAYDAAPTLVRRWGEGFGAANLSAVGDFHFVDIGPQPAGTSLTYCFSVADKTSVSATLVWTDPPASLAAAVTLVSDLDLTLTASDAVYVGNVGPRDQVTYDQDNNVERIRAVVSGAFSLRVFVNAAPVGPQPFALVVSGGGVVSLGSCPASCPSATASECSGSGRCSTATGRCTCEPYAAGADCSISVREYAVGIDSLDFALHAGEWDFARFPLARVPDGQGIVLALSKTFVFVEGFFSFAGIPDLHTAELSYYFYYDNSYLIPAAAVTSARSSGATHLNMALRGRQYAGLYYGSVAKSVFAMTAVAASSKPPPPPPPQHPPGPRTLCSGLETISSANGSSGSIAVPAPYHGSIPYGNDMACAWQISAPGKDIALHFSRFSTEAGYDIVTIDGQQYSGVHLDLTASSSSNMSIEFTSDGRTARPGFSARWAIGTRSPPACKAPMVINATTSGVAGALELPGPYSGVLEYAHNLECEWHFDFPEQSLVLSLDKSAFSTESVHDYVTILPAGVVVSGSLAASSQMVVPGDAIVRFHSNGDEARTGFSIGWALAGTPPPPGTGAPPPPPDSDKSSSSSGAVAAAIAIPAAIVLAASLAVGVVYWWRKSGQAGQTLSSFVGERLMCRGASTTPAGGVGDVEMEC
ncbi:protease [Thecamonas trahens ATCC 50062]|uniref:Protease n=1 Tax=Thecamonas trahens ATCC 50062 TaxID=461836 RepID=A0A0L0D266_THETB|nr:protease [Thecamonas trahens ATCC 50062]KNC46296.1 protease [Thecamonas trahens ATCC 50062]|eukprot:XP_013760590.1 protease [Thecamonas trahens ATCC 50062]